MTGLLLSSSSARTPEPAANPVARTGKLSGAGGGAGLSDTAIGLMATIGLLGLGALAEVRGAVPRLRERSR